MCKIGGQKMLTRELWYKEVIAGGEDLHSLYEQVMREPDDIQALGNYLTLLKRKDRPAPPEILKLLEETPTHLLEEFSFEIFPPVKYRIYVQIVRIYAESAIGLADSFYVLDNGSIYESKGPDDKPPPTSKEVPELFQMLEEQDWSQWAEDPLGDRSSPGPGLEFEDHRKSEMAALERLYPEVYRRLNYVKHYWDQDPDSDYLTDDSLNGWQVLFHMLDPNGYLGLQARNYFSTVLNWAVQEGKI